MSASPAAVAHYTEVARVATLEARIAKLNLALMDARLFISLACEQQILNAEECAPMLACYDQVLKESA